MAYSRRNEPLYSNVCNAEIEKIWNKNQNAGPTKVEHVYIGPFAKKCREKDFILPHDVSFNESKRDQNERIKELLRWI